MQDALDDAEANRMLATDEQRRGEGNMDLAPAAVYLDAIGTEKFLEPIS